MFVNRFIKALQHDTMVLSRLRNPSDGTSPFLFASKNVDDPRIDVGGGKIAAAEFFYRSLTLDRAGSREVNGKGISIAEAFGADVECQFFDFGNIGNEQIKEESLTVAEGYEVGLIDLPAPMCWFEHQWVCKETNATSSGYLFVKSTKGIVGAEIRLMSKRQLQEHNFTFTGKDYKFNDMKALHDHKEFFIWDGFMFLLPEGASAKGYECGVLVDTTGNPAQPNNVFDPLMSMLGRLNADGIDKVRVPAPAKLNRRRASKGLPGAVAYTEVKIRPYRAPMGHSGPLQGDRAAVRYHFRRGHVRHFQNGDVTWVRPCFVGDPGDGIVKHTYKVEAPHAR